ALVFVLQPHAIADAAQPVAEVQLPRRPIAGQDAAAWRTLQRSSRMVTFAAPNMGPVSCRVHCPPDGNASCPSFAAAARVCRAPRTRSRNRGVDAGAVQAPPRGGVRRGAAHIDAAR